MDFEEKVKSGEDIRRGIDFCKDYLLMAMYNANDRTQEEKDDFLESSQLADFYERVISELENLIESAIAGEPGIDTFDQAMLHEGAKETVRKRLGLTEEKENEHL